MAARRIRSARLAMGARCERPRAIVCLLLVYLVSGCAATGSARLKTFDVTLEMDFGPARKPPVRQVVQVEPGATPQDATAKVFPLEKGSVCCDLREVATIDGVAADPATNRWWTVSINGSKKVSPYKTRLKAGDVVRWEYKQDGQ